jgi:cytochrome c oxidase cbb3-type subunit 2
LPTDGDLLRVVTDGVRWTGMIGRPDLPEADRRAVVEHVKRFSPRFAAERPAPPLAIPPAPAATAEVVAQGQRLYAEAGCGSCHGERADGSPEMRDEWGQRVWGTDLTWRPLKRGSDPRATWLSIATGLAGTPMPAYADALSADETWAIVVYLDSLVTPATRADPRRPVGEEPRGLMALRHHGGGGRHRGH